MYVVDASVWVSRFVRPDVHHQPSYSWLQRVIGRGEIIVAPAVLLPEVAGAISRRTAQSGPAARAVALVEQIPSLRLVVVDDTLSGMAAELAGHLRLKSTDSLYVAVAQRAGFTLVTWDQQQLERGRTVAAAVTPQEMPQ